MAPRLTFSNEQMVVFDDFLPQEVVEEMLQYANDCEYMEARNDNYGDVWRRGDASAMRAATTLFRPDAMYKEAERPRYPTGTTIDRFIDTLHEFVAGNPERLGEIATPQDAIGVTPWIYRRGAGLSLHRDRGCAGAFIYYVHPEWHFHWGGHLLVLDPGTQPDLAAETLEQSYLWLPEEERNRIASEPGLATCVLAKSNRIVFLDRRALHTVTRIDADAGDHARISFGGYFLRPETAPREPAA
jgi:Rps23 Pro-64 3,4-dihydroxylase Tpa1-like proline 4-hydroxylase